MTEPRRGLSKMDRIPEDVMKKLCAAFKGEDLAKIIFFLASNKDNPLFVQILESTMNDDVAFEATATMMLQDAEEMKQDGSYARVMAEMWNSLLPFRSDEGDTQQFDLRAALANPELTKTAVAYNLITILVKMPPETQPQMLQLSYSLASAAAGQSFAVAVRNSVSSSLQTVRGATRKMVPVILAGVYLAFDVISNMKRWWKGEISGQRCVKNIVDSGLGLAAGIGGGIGGAAIGTFFLPGVGTIIGGIVGGIAAAECRTRRTRLSDWITQRIFDIPKSESVENAFRFMGLHHGASNAEINSKFRQLCLQYHPDKGGDVEDFYKLQMNMQVIKFAKE